MIRFTPDSWWDVVMRPLDMMSPEANIYVEVAAPDVRMAAALLLGIAVLACWSRVRTRADRRPALWLLLFTLVAMVPWLATTGNGRYFTPFLLLLGPLCVGLVRLLPLSTSMKFAAIGLLVLIQGALLVQDTPWGKWSLASWSSAPYFQVATPPAQPRSYVTITSISYSLIAPQFPAQSRWMNAGAPLQGRELEYSRKWLADAKSLYLVAPSIPAQTSADGQPSGAVIATFNRLLEPRGLSLASDVRCEFLRSDGLARMAERGGRHEYLESPERLGFYLCPLRYDPAAAAKPPAPDPAIEAVFEAVEQMCPRFFPRGEAQTTRDENGANRHYGSSDTRVFVLDEGLVRYKFWRSLNPVTIGTRADVLAGRAHLDCTKIRAGTWRHGEMGVSEPVKQ